MEKFNDSSLLELAKRAYYSNGNEPSKAVKDAMEKQSLTNEERNTLLTFVKGTLVIKPKSMAAMKKEILQKIGYQKPERSYYSTPNIIGREELMAIYTYIMGKAD